MLLLISANACEGIFGRWDHPIPGYSMAEEVAALGAKRPCASRRCLPLPR
jgi:hypothetical protein